MHAQEVTALAFNPSLPDEILIGTDSPGLQCLSASTGKVLRSVDTPASIRDISIGTDSSLVPAGSKTADACAVTLCYGKAIAHLRCTDLKTVWSHTMDRHPSIDTASVSHDGKYFVASGGEDCLEVAIGRVSDGKILKYESGHHGPIRCVRFNPCGKRFTSASEDGTVRIWPYDPAAAEAYAVKEEERLKAVAAREQAAGKGAVSKDGDAKEK